LIRRSGFPPGKLASPNAPDLIRQILPNYQSFAEVARDGSPRMALPYRLRKIQEN
jgi:hypothetical protein